MAGIWSRFFGSSVSTAAGYGMGSALGPALRPVTQAVANEAWKQYPNRPLSDAEVAEAVIRGLMDVDEAAAEALLTGTNAERFEILRGLAGQPIAPEQALDLWNRGVIDEGRVDEALRQGRMRPEWYGAFKALRRYLPSVSDVIRWGVREVFSPDQRRALDLDADFPPELAARLADLGYSDGDAHNAWAAHWELPSRTEGADMWHRGLLSDAEYDGLLRALDFAPTWRDKLREISNAIPGISDMIRFAVREVYNPTQRAALGLDGDYPEAFTKQARKHGLSESDARDFWAAHWNLPSATQGYHMLWREKITQAQLDDLLKALDYSPAWRSRLSDIAHLVPGRVDLRRMLAAGIVDRAYVKKGYQHIGYDDATAETLTKFAEQQAASGSTVHQKWAEKAKSRLFTVAHDEYLDDSLDVAGANAAFDVVGVPDGERPSVFAAWDKENEIVRTELTTAQIKKAYKATKLTQDEARSRLADKGIRQEDADIILET